jgi:hypothetical protein
MLIRIADVLLHYRHVELPERCPRCGDSTRDRIAEIQ